MGYTKMSLQAHIEREHKVESQKTIIPDLKVSKNFKEKSPEITIKEEKLLNGKDSKILQNKTIKTEMTTPKILKDITNNSKAKTNTNQTKINDIKIKNEVASSNRKRKKPGEINSENDESKAKMSKVDPKASEVDSKVSKVDSKVFKAET